MASRSDIRRLLRLAVLLALGATFAVLYAGVAGAQSDGLAVGGLAAMVVTAVVAILVY